MPVISYTPFIAFASKHPGLDSVLTIPEAAEILHTSPSVVRHLIRDGYVHATERNPRKRSCRVLESQLGQYLKFWFPAKRSDRTHELVERAAEVNAECVNPKGRAVAIAYKGFRGIFVEAILKVDGLI